MPYKGAVPMHTAYPLAGVMARPNSPFPARAKNSAHVFRRLIDLLGVVEDSM